MNADKLEKLRLEFEKAKADFDFWTSDGRCQYGSQRWAEVDARYQSTRDNYQFALAQDGRIDDNKPASDPSRLDGLLGICNQNAYVNDYPEFVRLANGRAPRSVITIDVDDFNAVNATYGHDGGDEVLKCIAAALNNVGDGKGSCYRKGGDEFVLLLPNHTAAESETLAHRLRDEISRSLEEIGRSNVTVSMGIASYPEIADNAGDLFSLADKALYAAQDAGKDSFRTADAGHKEAGPRAQALPRAAVKNRLPLPEISVRLIQCFDWQLLIELSNESDAEVLVRSIGLWA